MEENDKKRAARQCTRSAKVNRGQRIQTLYDMHRRKNEELTYKKDMLIIQTKAVKSDHDYTERKKHIDHSYYSLRS